MSRVSARFVVFIAVEIEDVITVVAWQGMVEVCEEVSACIFRVEMKIEAAITSETLVTLCRLPH
jgi:hypothetical protein